IDVAHRHADGADGGDQRLRPGCLLPHRRSQENDEQTPTGKPVDDEFPPVRPSPATEEGEGGGHRRRLQRNSPSPDIVGERKVLNWTRSLENRRSKVQSIATRNFFSARGSLLK